MREKIARMSVRSPHSLIVAALLLALPRLAGALCTATDVILSDTNCPAGTGACTISGNFTVDDGCTLDFGTRNVTLSGKLTVANVGSGTPDQRKHVGTMTVRAGNLSIAPSGLIDAIGQGLDETGGVVIIETTGAFTSQLSSRIDTSGNSAMGGGAIIVRAGTLVIVAGRLFSDSLNAGAAGGVVDLTSNGDMTLTANSTVSARGGSDSDGGGEIDLTAGGNLLVQSELRVDALDGGFIEVRADGTVTIGDVDASGGGDAGSGGCVDVSGGRGTTVTGDIIADGSTGTFMTGGCGGLICLDGDTGTMTVGATALISANGARPDGGGGQISLLALGSTVVSGTIQARGPNGETCGGDVCIDTGLDATIDTVGFVDVSGGDAGGAVEFIAGRDITVNGTLDLRGRQQAALGGDAALRAGNNGTGQLRVTSTIDASSASACSVVDGCGQGGSTDLFGCNVTLTNASSLLATGPDGGQHNITAREQLTVQGTVDASRTVANGSNGVTHIEHTARKTPILTGSNFAPAPLVQALATCPTQGPTQPPCLDPCPTCGNGQIEFPETCDNGVMPPVACGGCSVFCQIEDCDDGLTCTGDQCVPAVGCQHRVTPICTEPPTPTPTITGTRPTETATPTPSATRTQTVTPSLSATATASATGTATATRTATPTGTETVASTPTAPLTATPIASATAADTATPAPTASASSTATALDTGTATATASATATSTTPPTSTCAGDCNGDGSVTINELIAGVNIALGNTAVTSCPSFDRNSDGSVTINELIAGVNAALAGC